MAGRVDVILEKGFDHKSSFPLAKSQGETHATKDITKPASPYGAVWQHITCTKTTWNSLWLAVDKTKYLSPDVCQPFLLALTKYSIRNSIINALPISNRVCSFSLILRLLESLLT